MRARLSVFCDFDGTVSVKDVTDLLLEAYALPEWREIEALWQEGRIGSMECMSRQVALLRCSRKELDDLADGVAIDPHFPDFVADCREASLSVIILSDGLDYVIRRILRNHGLADLPVYANRLEMPGEARYRLSFPYARADCRAASGTCKCALMRRLPPPGAEKNSCRRWGFGCLRGSGSRGFRLRQGCAACHMPRTCAATCRLSGFWRHETFAHQLPRRLLCLQTAADRIAP